MSPLRHTRPARDRSARLGLVRLEARDVPAPLIWDPQLFPNKAVQELADAINDAAASPGADTITLFPGGVYLLDSKLPDLNPSSTEATTEIRLTLEGNGATLRRAPGAGDVGLLTIRGTTNYGRVSVRDLTLDGGLTSNRSGAAVSIQAAPASFTNVRFVNNAAPNANSSGGAVAISSAAAANWENVFTDCLFFNNSAGLDGGAVALSGVEGNSYAVENKVVGRFLRCQFTANSAGRDGGAIASLDDDVAVDSSGLAYNTAGRFGGGLSVLADVLSGAAGSAIGPTNAVLVNSTVDSNAAGVAGGGVYVEGGVIDFRVLSSTITANTAKRGGGMAQDQGAGNAPNEGYLGQPRDITVVKADFTVFAGNTGKGDGADLSGRFTGNTTANLVQVQPAADSTYTLTVGGKSTTFGSQVNGDPGLGPLQNNGGGTLTRAPLSNSGLSVLSTTQPNYPTNFSTGPLLKGLPIYDQRGVAGYERLARRFLDLGAYEVQDDGAVSLAYFQSVDDKGRPVFGVDGTNQATGTETLFPVPLRVVARDPYGALITDRPVVLQYPETVSGQGATFPLGSTVTINPGAAAGTPGTGVATVYAFANKGRNGYTLNVRDADGTVIPFRLFNRPQLGGVGVAGADTRSATVGAPFAPLSVTVTDTAGDPVAGADVTFVVQLAAGGSAGVDPLLGPPAPPAADPRVPSGAFAGGVGDVSRQLVTVKTDANGVATAALTAGSKAGQYTVLVSAAATDPASGGPVVLARTQFDLTNTADVPAAIRGAGQLDQSGTDLSGSGQQVRILQNAVAPLVAVVTDRFGNPVPGLPDPANPGQTLPAVVTFSNADPGRAAGLANSGGTAATDALGRATFVPQANSKVEAAPYTVRATTAGGLSADFQLTNVPGLPAAVAVVSGDGQFAPVSDNRVAAGDSNRFAAPLRVRVTDAGGNPVPGALVTFSGSGVRFVTSRVPTDADGVAVAVAATTELAGTFRDVSARAETGTGAAFTLTATPAAPAAVAVVAGGGQTARAGEAFAQPLVVRVLDQFQNPVPGVTPAVFSGGAAVTASATDGSGLSTVRVTAGTAVGPITVTAGVGALAASAPLTVAPQPDGPPRPQTGVPALTAVGLGGGIASRVTVYNADGSPRTHFAPFDPGFLGGTRSAIARTPTGGTVVVVPGPGRFPDAQVFSADDGTPLAAYQPFEQTFTGGVFVSTGDIDRDGFDDYVFSADVGGGPRVQVRSGRTGVVVQDFFGIDDPAFRGGARTAVGDVNGDGTPDLVVAAGVGGGPRIAVYDGRSLVGFRAVPVKLQGDFFAFETTLRNGAYVAAGDVNGDGAAEIVLGGGPGGGPRVRVLDGRSFAAGNQQVPLSDFFAGPSTDRGGVTVAVRNLDGDARNDIVAGSGSGTGSRVSVFLGRNLRPGQPLADRGFDDLTGFRGGVFVG